MITSRILCLEGHSRDDAATTGRRSDDPQSGCGRRGFRSAARDFLRGITRRSTNDNIIGKDNLIFTTWKGEGSAHIDAKGNYSWSPTEYARDRQLSIPAPASISEMSGGSDLSAVESCPAIRRFLKDNHVQYGNKAVDAAMKRRDPDVIFASLSLARVDRGGDHALIAEGFSGTIFGGGGWLNLMARDKKGSWHRTHSAPTWIS